MTPTDPTPPPSSPIPDARAPGAPVTANAPGASVRADELDTLRASLDAELPAFLADLERLVNVDCGSYTKAGVDEVGAWTARFLEELGAEVTRHIHPTFGDTIVGELAGAGGPRLLLVGHLDTVFPEGTAAERPFRIDDGIARGPGVTDMKGGLLTGLYALRALRRLGPLPFAAVTFIANPDEEIGSPSSTALIAEHAVAADACLVLECARANGDIVSSRKGTLDFRVVLHGRAAHAGVEPEKGRSAILAAAHLVPRIHALPGRWADVTCNVGTIAGGTRPNVVAERATLEIDLRAATGDHLDAAEAALREIVAEPGVPDVRVEIERLSGHRPMERLPASVRLVEHAVALADRLGFPLRDAATGGASDANTTAGLGIPTLDGLGPIGGLDHSPEEYLEVESIVPRTTLLAALMLAIGRDGGGAQGS